MQTLSCQLASLSNGLNRLELASRQLIWTNVTPHVDTTFASASETCLMKNGSQIRSLEGVRCLCSQRAPQTVYHRKRHSGFFRTKVSSHQPHCPLYIPSSVVITLGVRFRLHFIKAASSLETGIEYGPFHIAPHIRYRNVAPSCGPQRSPVFQLSELLFRFIYDNEVTLQEFDAALGLTFRAISHMFRQRRASILDTDQKVEPCFM
jgi:hypothetical protein